MMVPMLVLRLRYRHHNESSKNVTHFLPPRQNCISNTRFNTAVCGVID